MGEPEVVRSTVGFANIPHSDAGWHRPLLFGAMGDKFLFSFLNLNLKMKMIHSSKVDH